MKLYNNSEMRACLVKIVDFNVLPSANMAYMIRYDTIRYDTMLLSYVWVDEWMGGWFRIC